MQTLENFRKLGLSEKSIKALAVRGFEEPTSIQTKCIPVVLKDKMDVLGEAQTGTGKTAAFGLPLLEIINPDLNKVQTLILTPTRELAIQVVEEINSLKGDRNLKITAIYGGQSIEQQFKRLKEGVQIIVGTPGRVIDHLKRKKLILDHLTYFVLDEADEMLNMGFIEDIEKILEFTPKQKRMLLFSATMPNRILNLAKKYMSEYKHVKIAKEELTTKLIDQIYFEVRESDKFEALSRIIDTEEEFYGLVFCRTKLNVDSITQHLIGRGYDADGVHGDIAQNQREKIFGKFKSKKINILVATDVAARGIDVSNLTHVINYALPQDPESYIHRIGRTGRAGNEGTAITFITPSEYRKLDFIKRITNTNIRKEKLPNVDDVIKIKKTRIIEDIAEIIQNGEHKEFGQFAGELTKNHDPQNVLAAILKYAFADELHKGSYGEIMEATVDNKGKNRLFIAKGSRDNMTKDKLIDFITKKTGIKDSLITDIKIRDIFSFITVPFKESEIILHAFKSWKKGHKPMVEKANGRG